MKRSIGLWQFFGFAVTAFMGTVLHFLYEWLDKAKWIAPFSGVNESTWEHMKLLFWPMLLFAITEYFFFRDREDFWCIKLRGILCGLILIPILFYTYNGVIGKSPDWINITIFFVSAAIAYFREARAFARGDGHCTGRTAAFAVLLSLAALFILFTFKTPALGIFRDPLTGSYGV